MSRLNEWLKQIAKELQGVRPEIQNLIKTSKEYAGPFESIEVSTIKTFSRANGDCDRNLLQDFNVFPLKSDIDKDDKKRNKRVTKRIHFIRHGEGHHNVGFKNGDLLLPGQWIPDGELGTKTTIDKHPDFAYVDSLLTNEGEQQAISLQSYIAQNCSECTVLILSPLRRATQTGLLAFANEIKKLESSRKSPLKIIIKEEAHEKFGAHPCDLRLDVKDLRHFFYEGSGEKYGNMLNEAGLNLDYYLGLSESDPFLNNGSEPEKMVDVAKRGCKLLKMIYEMNDVEVAIAAHAGFLRAIFEAVVVNKSETATTFLNGEIKTCDVDFNLI
jgi:broad specificity phosphatase PhoE